MGPKKKNVPKSDHGALPPETPDWARDRVREMERSYLVNYPNTTEAVARHIARAAAKELGHDPDIAGPRIKAAGLYESEDEMLEEMKAEEKTKKKEATR